MATKTASGKGGKGGRGKKGSGPTLPAEAPERLQRFFSSGEHEQHEGRFAFGMEYFASDTKLKVSFSPEGARDVIDGYGDALPETALVVPLATLGKESDLALVVDPRQPELPVLFFEHEAGYHPFAPSFDAFLAGLLQKGQKTPLELLADACKKARKLQEKEKHADVVALLEPALKALPDVKPRAYDDLAETHPEAINLLGLAYQGLGRLDEAVVTYERAMRLGSEMAALNLCDLDLERFHDYERLARSARALARTSYLLGEAYEWFHARNYLGLAATLLGDEPVATRTYHQIWKAFRVEKPERLEKSVAELRTHAREGRAGEIAARIIGWLTPVKRTPDPERQKERRQWWKSLGKAAKELPAKLAEAGGVKGDPTDEELERLVELDSLDLEDLGLKDLAFLAPLRRLESLDVGGCGVSDLSSLPELPVLRRLRAGESKLKGLRGVERAPRLTHLFVRECKGLDSLQGVEALGGLKELDVADCKIGSLEPLRALAELEELTAYHNRIEDLAPLGDCRRLKKLSIFDNKVKGGLAALKALPFLESIDAISWKVPVREMVDFARARPDVELDVEIDSDELEAARAQDDGATTDVDLSFWAGLDPRWKAALKGELDEDEPLEPQLGKLREVTSLFAGEKGLTRLEPLRHLARVDFLEVSDNALTDLSPAAALPRLRQLRADRNQVGDVRGLSGCQLLEELDLEENRLTSLEGLQGCPALRELELSGNAIAAIEPLAGLVELRQLTLGENQVQSLAPLGRLVRLRELDVHGCTGLRDLSPLAACHDLEELDCYGVGGLDGLGALVALPRLRRVTSHGGFAAAELEAFRARRPDVEID